jgi:hypothetical protein
MDWVASDEWSAIRNDTAQTSLCFSSLPPEIFVAHIAGDIVPRRRNVVYSLIKSSVCQ